jgi:hypothetical protein
MAPGVDLSVLRQQHGNTTTATNTPVSQACCTHAGL